MNFNLLKLLSQAVVVTDTFKKFLEPLSYLNTHLVKDVNVKNSKNNKRL